MTNQWPPPPPPPFSAPGSGPSEHAPFATGPRPPARGPSAIAVAAIIAVVTLLIAAGVVALVARDDKEIETTSETTSVTSTTRPATGSTSPQTGSSTTVASSDLERFIDEAIVFIERERGIDFVSRPTVVALDDAAFVARFREVVDEDAKKNAKLYDEVTGIFQAVGLLARDVTYIDAQKALGEGGVLGYYDPESKELRVRAGQLTPLARTVIVHELTHALDDQRYNLNRPQYDTADDEIGFGFVALVEGNARRVENAYRDSMSSADKASAAAEEQRLALAGALSLAKLTLAMIQLELAPYDQGEKFVDAVLANGGRPALEKAFSDPPHTSEQVLYPDKYFSKEARREVKPPNADGTVFKSGVFGEITLRAILGAANSSRVAETAAAGWAGDWYVAWRDSNRVCVRTDFVMESSKDTTELRDALTKWAQTRPSGKVTNNGDAVEVTTCSR